MTIYTHYWFMFYFHLPNTLKIFIADHTIADRTTTVRHVVGFYKTVSHYYRQT